MSKRHKPDSDRRKWDDEEVQKFLRTYRKLPALWDSASPDYKCYKKKCHAMSVLCDTFNTTTEEVRRKIHNLRCTFNGHIRRVKTLLSANSVDRESAFDVCKWKFFDDMKFLLPVLTPELCFAEEESIGDNDDEVNEVTLQLSEPEADETEIYSKPRKKAKRKKSEEHIEKTINFQESYFNNSNSEEYIIAKNPTDEHHDVFGKYVASELKNLSSRRAKKLKLLISKAIIKINEEDEANEDEIKEETEDLTEDE